MTRRADVVVVGCGLAGSMAASRLAEAGAEVVMVSAGAGCLGLAPAWLDVVGRAGGPVGSVGEGLAALGPAHPYSILGELALREALAHFFAQAEALGYVGGLGENMALPTSLGGAHPAAAAPRSMAAGDLRRGGSVAIVGIGGMRDFSAALVAQNLAAFLGAEVSHAVVDLGGIGWDLDNLSVARRLEEPGLRAALAREVSKRVGEAQRIGFPAVLGLHRHEEVFEDLVGLLGREVFEIATPPPSVPGMRLAAALGARRRLLGVAEVLGAKVTGAQRQGDEVSALVVAKGSREEAFEASHFVLATGGVLGGGIQLGPAAAKEAVFGLETAPSAAGLALDGSLRPLSPSGEVLLANVAFPGAAIAGADPLAELSAQGLCVQSGFVAAEAARKAAR